MMRGASRVCADALATANAMTATIATLAAIVPRSLCIVTPIWLRGTPPGGAPVRIDKHLFAGRGGSVQRSRVPGLQ
jgi:hypothetical protein